MGLTKNEMKTRCRKHARLFLALFALAGCSVGPDTNHPAPDAAGLTGDTPDSASGPETTPTDDKGEDIWPYAEETSEDACNDAATGEDEDLDLDGQSDPCDVDDDGDGVIDEVDNCPRVTNVGQLDTDNDGNGDACDDDDDDDGAADDEDNCRTVPNASQTDTDGDGMGDACTGDKDSDGVLDPWDNCPFHPNLQQQDTDGDGIGNACDDDDDGDGQIDPEDNCPEVPNITQVDADGDGIGDACDPEPGLWLLSIDNITHQLFKVNVETAETKLLCDLPSTDKYPSLTFSRSGLLYASNNTEDRLDIINPCDCTITPVGPYGYTANMVGITTDHATDLFGVDMLEDWLVHIDTATGLATPIGTLGISLVSSGATWSDALGAIYAINGLNGTLNLVDPETGVATHLADLTIPFNYVGIELHPSNDTIYTCTGPNLYAVDTDTGYTKLIGPISPNECNNLAAPYTPIGCVDGDAT